jgi:putative ribosome biogenesis GTPase RsgA
MANLEELRGRHVCVLVGTTGTGKSTLANSMIQGKDQLVKDKQGFFQVKQGKEVRYAA